MYKITVQDKNGSFWTIENVLDYNVIDLGLVNTLTDEFETKLTNEEIKELEERLGYWEKLPETNQLQGIIEDIINDRE